MASARLRHILACIDPAASESLSVSLSSLIVSFTAARTDVDPLDPFASSAGLVVDIAGIKVPIDQATRAVLVPFRVAREPSWASLSCPEAVAHLKWMAQKEALDQDMFLIGAPGPLKRWLAFKYCELTHRECEYVALTRDTSESDLKQRREIRGSSAFFIDLPAVSAAIHGRILVLEGLEKCERNVLPLLNNLLENREMALEDGRFLVSPERYDKLLKTHDQAELDRLKLVRTSPRFRVIALGLPVPRYTGNPLDPPLRSRFQCRDIFSPSLESKLRVIRLFLASSRFESRTEFEKTSIMAAAEALIAFAEAIDQLEQDQEGGASLGINQMPRFPESSIRTAIELVATYPRVSVARIVQRIFPYKLVDLTQQSIPALNLACSRFFTDTNIEFELVSIVKTQENQATCTLRSVELRGQAAPQVTHTQQLVASKNDLTTNTIACGRGIPMLRASTPSCELHYHRRVVAEAIMDQSVGADICLIGERGIGKTALAGRLATLLGYGTSAVTMHLYKDMSARDLLQRRTTSSTGDTVWENTPLVSAAVAGGLVILDGVDRLAPSTLAILQRLHHDRELSLFDGTSLVRWDRFEKMRQHHTDEELRSMGLIRVHESFRIIAVAYPPSIENPWLTAEVLPMFHVHHLEPLQVHERREMLLQLFPTLATTKHLESLLAIDAAMQQIQAKLQQDDQQQHQVIGKGVMHRGISLRQYIRACKHWVVYSNEEPERMIRRLCACLPTASQEIVLKAMASTFGSELRHPRVLAHTPLKVELERCPRTSKPQLRIGNIVAPVNQPQHPALVPHVSFHDMPMHVLLLQELLQDYVVGENMLLIGPQGVGKNMLADRLLELLQLEREYIQLHRDTTVQSLTISPTLRDGVIVWEDSPLVAAVQNGRVLVVDEADKAPLEVVCILKGLVEDGEMMLSDGRRILARERLSEALETDRIIPIAHGFRVIMLANKQGYPFLGNDLLNELGDCFSCHEVGNPDEESERSLLRFYGPNVSEHFITLLSKLFRDLRSLVDQGLLAYPYSTRELVNVVRHLNQYPNDSLVSVLQNIFSFDRYDPHLVQHLLGVFHRQGIPMDLGAPVSVQLATREPLPAPVTSERWQAASISVSGTEVVPSALIEKGGWVLNDLDQWRNNHTKRRTRLGRFTEQTSFWLAGSNGLAKSIVTSRDGMLHAVCTQAISIVSFGPTGAYEQERAIDLSRHLRYTVTMGGELEVFPYFVELLALQHSNVILLHIPAFFFLLHIDLDSGGARAFSLDPSGASDGAFSVYNSTAYLGQGFKRMFQPLARNQINESVISATLPSLSLDVMAFGHRGASAFSIVDFTSLRRYYIALPVQGFELENLVAAEEELLVFGVDGRVMVARWRLEPGAPSLQFKIAAEFHRTDMTSPQLSSFVRCAMFATRFATPPGGFSFSGTHAIAQWLEDRPAHQRNTALLAIPRQPVALSAFNSAQADCITIGSLRLRNLNAQVNVICEMPVAGNHSLRMWLEVVDFDAQDLRVIAYPLSLPQDLMPGQRRVTLHHEIPLVSLAEMPNGEVACLVFDAMAGVSVVRTWQFAAVQLQQALDEWKSILGIGSDASQNERNTIAWEKDKEAVGPKDGISDGKEHHGGNRFKGGTGGADTAGMGGKSGPYRVDGGYDVYQIEEAQKAAVSEKVRETQRAMRLERYRARLDQINMNEQEASLYEQYMRKVQLQIGQLRVILQAVQAKAKERVWLKHQTTGEIDDMKLVDGLVGARTVYKHRGEMPPEAGSFQEKPKRLRFVMDCSGSMYRFNGQDKRLDRLLEATCMIMESFSGYEAKYSYSIVGHSGDGPEIPFVDYKKPPVNAKERLQVLLRMQAHSEYCSSGDKTVEALQCAVREVVREPADDYFVFLVSDANLRRYNVNPDALARLMTYDQRVNCFAIFVASLADEASLLKSKLPVGSSHICLDTSTLPAIFKQIFASSLLRDKL